MDKERNKLIPNFEGFALGVFYSFSVVMFMDGAKPSLTTLIISSLMVFPMFIGYLLLEAFLSSRSGSKRIEESFNGYGELIVHAIVHFILGYFIYSVIH